ncbi:MAG: ribosome silencing factor [Bacteroidota bacterium]|nr:ribosome silencing factor [Bacteroidota bacterium]
MPGKKKKSQDDILKESILKALGDKKAVDPVIMDLTKIQGAVCDAFIICNGTSRTQVEALADGILSEVKKSAGISPWHMEGFENAEWILIDYVSIVVHIFQDSRRKYYNLEQLWGDAEITKIDI